MDTNHAALKQSLDVVLDRMLGAVDWHTPRDIADPLVWEAVQACHALHRAATPAYRERCEREGIGDTIRQDQLPLVVFPEEIWKGYSEIVLPNGKKMGVFCEQDVPRLLEYLNQYLSEPLRMDGLQTNYMSLTNLRGGLDQLRADLLKSQGVMLLTSSGTSGSALSLIPIDARSYEMRKRCNRLSFDLFSDVPGYGPIVPEHDCLIAYAPRDGSMLMIVAMQDYANKFNERKFLTIPASVHTRELRWRAGLYAGFSGKLLKILMAPLQTVGGKRTAQMGLTNTIDALKKAEALGVRALVFANQWMIYKALLKMQSLLEAEIQQGIKQPGEPFVKLAPGSAFFSSGGNKSGLDIPAAEVMALIHKLIGGLDKTRDGYGKSEAIINTLGCQYGNYHLDPYAVFFKIDGYLAFFDPRETGKVPAQITGDLVDDLCYEPCPCGMPTGYYKSLRRDNQKRGSKGCAAALQEYAYR